MGTPMQRGKMNLLTNIKTPSPVHCYKASYFSIILRERLLHMLISWRILPLSFLCSGKNLNIQETEVAKAELLVSSWQSCLYSHICFHDIFGSEIILFHLPSAKGGLSLLKTNIKVNPPLLTLNCYFEKVTFLHYSGLQLMNSLYNIF